MKHQFISKSQVSKMAVTHLNKNMMKNNIANILIFSFILCMSFSCSSSDDAELTEPPTDNSGTGSGAVGDPQTDYDILVRNPVIQTWYTPDPAPMVYKDTLFLFVDHDEDDADYFKMKDWQLYSTTDMINWTYRGTPMTTATFAWANQGDKAWAAQAIEHNGKFYWYMCAQDAQTGADVIGVAVADSPVGPYRDARGEPLAPATWGYIDPSVFIDDDGQAYLFWGNNNLWYAKLSTDMISFEGDIHQVNVMDESAFGPIIRTKNDDGSITQKTNYEEGSWVYKRNGIYYLLYAAGGIPEYMAYSTATDIAGPWKYQGRIMDSAEQSFTIHGGNVDFKGRHFMFYHNGILPNGGGFRRSTCVEEFSFTSDGRIPFMHFTETSIRKSVGTLNPCERVEAETMAWSQGLKTDQTIGHHHYVTSIHNGDYLKVSAVQFAGKEYSKFSACVAATKSGGRIEVRIGSRTGPLLAKLEVTSTGAMDDWQDLSVDVSRQENGLCDLYFVFLGDEGELFNVDYWQFK